MVSRMMLLDLVRGSLLGNGFTIMSEVKLGEMPECLRHACSGCGRILFLERQDGVEGIEYSYCSACGVLYYCYVV